ncbi:MAG TPA: cation-translocating P-type ATPase [Thermodesulfobacteriota bacterium]|nr:cation-translocating P-type ATPase [Thermodesulfobacteriota bacterium]
MEWHKETVSSVLNALGSKEQGLSSAEAARRLEETGPNSLKEPPAESFIKKFLKQFTEFIVLVLIGAAVIAAILGEWVDASAIMAIVALNAFIGFTQEEKAAKVLSALKKLSAPKAKVLRDNEPAVVSASEVVPGDVVLLDAGDIVPADLRIISGESLRIDEAALTGESHPVGKDAGRLENSLPLADRTNMAYSGTTVVYGRGAAVTVGTGMATELGKIADMLEKVKPEPTPLQKKLSEFGRFLVYAAAFVCVLIFVLGVLRGNSALLMFLTAVSLAVAAIPEGLPAVVTITLAIGVQKMVKRNALIRKLPSVETLGSANVIASDKTGTITQNQMTVRKLYVPDGVVIDVTGRGYEPVGEFFNGASRMEASGNKAVIELLRATALCNTASIKKNDNSSWLVIGDPTEGALLSAAMKAGLEKDSLLKEFLFAGEIPFDSERKLMTSVYEKDGEYYAFIKGAPENVLPLCDYFREGDALKPLVDEMRRNINATNEAFSSSGLRVLAVAYRKSLEPFDTHFHRSVEKDLVFLGLTGMMDPPRAEVIAAVEKAKAAGITPIMITGDHKLTAVAIAKEVGIFNDGDEAITGVEFEGLSADELARRLPFIKVYARVNPEHKLRIVKAWKGQGAIIAMTGDGVNDAPALKEADIGISMGITGTDVTREASDMVLIDDNFASIVSAVEEGRGIFNNIRKVVHFLLSCNIGEVLVLFVATLLGMPLPLLPVQILWTNLVTDGLPALGLAMEAIDPSVMDRKPRTRKEGIVTRRLLWVMILQGVFMAFCTLSVFAYELYAEGASLVKAQTMAFTVLVFCQKFHVFNCRHERESVFSLGVFSNKTLNLAVFAILLTQIAIVYVPGLNTVFKIERLGITDWLIVVAASVQPLVLMEVVKGIRRRYNSAP